MHRVMRSYRFACKLSGPIRDYFICVRVGARAGTSLKDIEGKMFVELTFSDFFGRLRDQRRALGIEQTEIVVRLRSRPLY